MSKKIILPLTVVVILIIAGLILTNRRPSTSPPQQTIPAPSTASSREKQVSTPSSQVTIKLLNLPNTVIAGKDFTLQWRVETPEPQTISHTAIHWDTVAHPGKLDNTITPAQAGYLNFTPEFASGTFSLPREFTATLTTPLSGKKIYLRAHAIIKGKNFWTNEEEIAIQPSSPATNNTNSNTQPTSVNPPSAPASPVKEFNITARQWAFDPATITVKQGDTVKLVIKSIDVTHGIALPAFDISRRLEPGKTVTIEFTADQKGTYSFFCSVFCGAGHSDMKGTLIVE